MYFTSFNVIYIHAAANTHTYFSVNEEQQKPTYQNQEQEQRKRTEENIIYFKNTLT